MIEVELPDGSIAEFPDGTPREVMQGAIKKRLGMASPQPAAPAGGGVALPPRADSPPIPRGAPTLDERIAGAVEGIRAPIEAVQNKVMEGMTFGAAGDEFRAGLGAAVSGKPYDQALEQERANEAAFAKSNPVASTGAEIAGAVMSPVGAAKTIAGAVGLAGATGAALGFAEGEGNAKSRAVEAAKSGATSMLFGGALAAGQKGISASFERLFNKVAKRPTVEGLRAVKTRAYAAVDAAGEKFSPAELGTVYQKAVAAADDANYVPDVDRQTFAALKILEGNSNKTLTLGQLDKLRQGLWKRYTAAENEVGILGAIEAVDELIDSKAGASAVMGAAREANSRFRKSEMLEDAFNKARLQTESTGSGGNILNKYRQAVTAIVTNPRKAKWFSGEEIAAMEKFIEGNLSENIMRRIGKLAPGGNGLMQALNLVAASVDPGFLAVSGAAQGAKFAADRGAMRGADALQDLVATGKMPAAPVRNYAPAARAGGVLGSPRD